MGRTKPQNVSPGQTQVDGASTGVHRSDATTHNIILYRRTRRSAYRRCMAYLVSLTNDSTERVEGADAYQLEGPLTTFFRTAPGRAVVDCWSTRLASFRTVDIKSIRAVEAAVSA